MIESFIGLVNIPLFAVELLCAFVCHHFVLLFFLFVMFYWLHSQRMSLLLIDHHGTERQRVIFGDGVKFFLINIHLSHCGACIFPVRALNFPYVYYVPLYHQKRNNVLHLTDLFIPVSLTHYFV